MERLIFAGIGVGLLLLVRKLDRGGYVEEHAAVVDKLHAAHGQMLGIERIASQGGYLGRQTGVVPQRGVGAARRIDHAVGDAVGGAPCVPEAGRGAEPVGHHARLRYHAVKFVGREPLGQRIVGARRKVGFLLSGRGCRDEHRRRKSNQQSFHDSVILSVSKFEQR